MIQLKYENDKVLLDNELVPVYGEYDVVVVGGGMAGVGAAVAAGRAGAKTILIENTSALGGLATMGLVNIPLDFLSGLGTEMFERLEKVNGLKNRNTDPEKHKILLRTGYGNRSVSCFMDAGRIDESLCGTADSFSCSWSSRSPLQ